MFDKKIKPNTAEGEKIKVALLLIKQYEDENYPIPAPNPIDAIKIKMQEMGLKNKDLIGKVGTKGYVSALLNKTFAVFDWPVVMVFAFISLAAKLL